MENPPIDILQNILEYIVPLDRCSNHRNLQILKSRKPSSLDHLYHVPGHDRTWEIQITIVTWVANLRRINHHWKDLIDQNDRIWFNVADHLLLDPPKHLYAGGSYLEVCRLLVRAEKQRESVFQDATEKFTKLRAQKVHRIACGIGFGSVSDIAEHPAQQKTHIKFANKLKTRLAQNASSLESFLGSVNFAIGSERERGQWAENAVTRYKMFLRLKQMYPNTWLVPTVEIEFCWLAHIFRTEQYWKEMNQNGINPDHKLYLMGYGEVVSWPDAVRSTASLWEKEFGCAYVNNVADISSEVWAYEVNYKQCLVKRKEHHQFFPQMGPKPNKIVDSLKLPHISLTKEEIQADLSWHDELKKAYQHLKRKANGVTPLRTNWDYFLVNHLIPSYERYLNLVLSLPGGSSGGASLGPPIALDLVWHAHQMEPVRYKEDCLEFFGGKEFFHDPWPNGLGVMSESNGTLECAWKTLFGTTMEDDWKFSPQGIKLTRHGRHVWLER